MFRIGVMVLMLGACVAEDGERVENIHDVELAEPEVCDLAAALPAEDACSMICDPDAFADRLRDSGMKNGACYQVRCALSADTSVTVGICLL